jgi:hypothetical protein
MQPGILIVLLGNTRAYPKVSGLSRQRNIRLKQINTRSEATQMIMAANLTRMTHKIVIQLRLAADSCTICSSRSRRPVR